MDETKLSEIKTLCELEMSIINFGKIQPDKTGYFASDEEKERLNGLSKLQDKYSYGWYIAEQTIEEQIISINKFKRYILSV
jgi:hypothetical protein